MSPYSERHLIGSAVFVEITSVISTQTDRQTDIRTDHSTCDINSNSLHLAPLAALAMWVKTVV